VHAKKVIHRSVSCEEAVEQDPTRQLSEHLGELRYLNVEALDATPHWPPGLLRLHHWTNQAAAVIEL
jgi:hypothetical protein